MEMKQWGYLLYAVEGRPLWHQRLLLGVPAGSSATEAVVATPDGDVYVENMDLESGDLAAARFSRERWPPPPGVPRDRTYRFNFRTLTDRRMRELEGLAVKAAEAHLREEARQQGRAYNPGHLGPLIPLGPVLPLSGGGGGAPSQAPPPSAAASAAGGPATPHLTTAGSSQRPPELASAGL